MVMRVALLLLLLCSAHAMAAPRFSAKLDKTRITLGEPLTLELRVEDGSAPIAAVDLQKLKQDFNVYASSSASQQIRVRGRNVKAEILTLTLYPLRSGQLQIPALDYGGRLSKALPVNVLHNDKQVIFRLQTDQPRPLVRQAVTLSLEILDDGSMQWSVPRQLTIPGVHQRWVGESQREETLQGTRYTLHRYVWVLMPLRDGEVRIELPILDAFKFGTRQRFPQNPLKLDVLPAPAYLPVHVPIGKPVLSMDELPAEAAMGSPFNWKLNIQGAGLNREALGKLLPSLQQSAEFRFYPPQIAQTDIAQAASAMQTWQVTIPMVPLRSGNIKLPEIFLPYFDLQRGRVDAAVLAGSELNVFSPAWRTMRRVLLGLAVLLLVAGVAYWQAPRAVFAWRKRKLLKAILSSGNTGQLRRLLLNFPAKSGAQTLRQWQLEIERQCVTDARFARAIQALERALYSEMLLDAESLRAALVQVVQALRLKYPHFKL